MQTAAAYVFEPVQPIQTATASPLPPHPLLGAPGAPLPLISLHANARGDGIASPVTPSLVEPTARLPGAALLSTQPASPCQPQPEDDKSGAASIQSTSTVLTQPASTCQPQPEDDNSGAASIQSTSTVLTQPASTCPPQPEADKSGGTDSATFQCTTSAATSSSSSSNDALRAAFSASRDASTAMQAAFAPVIDQRLATRSTAHATEVRTMISALSYAITCAHQRQDREEIDSATSSYLSFMSSVMADK